MNLTAGISDILLSIRKSNRLSKGSLETVDKWLSEGCNSELVRELESLLLIASEAGVKTSQILSSLSFAVDPIELTPVNPRYFRDVPLPPGLTIDSLHLAMKQTQRMIAQINRNLVNSVGYPLINFIQSNNYSGVISNILTDCLDQFSTFKHNHDQRYPDLINPDNGTGLEMKAANKPGKGGESHNGHGGWHLIACFDLNKDTGNILFVNIEVAELKSSLEYPGIDWRYCGSTVNEDTGSQRTETYYTTSIGTSKLRNGSVYLDTDRVTNWMKWRHSSEFPAPPFSPLYFQNIDNKTKVPSLRNSEKMIKWSSVKTQLNKLDPLWPLYDKSKLADIGLSEELIAVIRPED